MPPCRFLALILLFAVSAHAGNSDAPIVREEGAIYLSDFGTRALKTKVIEAAPTAFHIKLQDYAGTLQPGQTVEILAIAENGTAYRVRGQAQQGQVLAWVSPQYLAPLTPPDLIANLKKAAERKKIVDALIQKNQVAMGMTPAEVGQSLGKPQKKTNKADKDGTQQIWEYVKYVLIPQQVPGYVNGNLVYNTVYIKKPNGTLTVTFTNELVSSLEQSEGTISSGNEVQIVVPPVNVYW